MLEVLTKYLPLFEKEINKTNSEIPSEYPNSETFDFWDDFREVFLENYNKDLNMNNDFQEFILNTICDHDLEIYKDFNEEQLIYTLLAIINTDRICDGLLSDKTDDGTIYAVLKELHKIDLKNKILNTICDIWKKELQDDYNKGLLLNEDTLKCAFYFHLRNKLNNLMMENNLSIYTEYLGNEFKGLKYRPDMVVVKFKDNCKEEYLMDHIEEVIIAIELKFKGKNEYDSIIADREKIREYVRCIDNKCQYILGVIHEKYWKYPFWLDNRQANNWAKGRVTELVANYEEPEENNMNFQTIIH